MKKSDFLWNRYGRYFISGLLCLFSITSFSQQNYCSSASWTSSVTYSYGTKVVHGQKSYIAKWGTTNAIPGTDPNGPWQLIDVCALSNDCNYASWNASSVYSSNGIKVSYDGKIYRSKWYNQNITPGIDPWGPWELIDLCAFTTGCSQSDWNASVSYATTQVVKYGNTLYRAKWGNQNNQPGNLPDGPWEFVGKCGGQSPNDDDISVTYIKRLPNIPYIVNSSNPTVEGWPTVGQQVQWRAYVRNWSSQNKNGVSYSFKLNGVTVQSGTLTIPANGLAFVDYNWVWNFTRNQLVFTIDANNLIPEFSEKNNSLTIFTNALSAQFFVEQSLYNHFHLHQHQLGAGTNGFEDWVQILHARKWNKMFETAIYPETPNGVLDRIRVDSIAVVPDGALPLISGYLATNCPSGDNNKIADLQWGFPSDLLNNDFYKNYTDTIGDNPFFFEGSFLHELGHARYLVDGYAFNVHDDGTGSTVKVLENGNSIVNTPYLPMISSDAVFFTTHPGLMSGPYTFVDRYAAAMLNRIAGRRAVIGSCNAPGNFGIYVNDLPSENIFILKDPNGNNLSNAAVKIYQDVYFGGFYPKEFDNTPDLQFTSNATGRFNVGQNPFQNHPLSNYGAEGVILIRVETATHIGYEFFESSWFNLEYFKGNTTHAEYTIVFDQLVSKSSGFKMGTDLSSVSSQGISAYPNPFRNELTLDISLEQKSKVEIEIETAQGISMGKPHSDWMSEGNHLISVNTSDFPSGLMILKVKYQDKTFAYKIVKE